MASRRNLTISVLGCGRWGTFIAWYLDKIGHKVLLWGRPESKNLKRLKEERTNEFLTLPQSIELGTDLHKAIRSDIIVISISAQNLRALMHNLREEDLNGKTIVLCMKGIEESTGYRLTEVVKEIKPDLNVAIWVGPGHVEDFTKGIPNCMVIDSENEDIKKFLIDEFTSELIRFYYGTDLIGNEIGAASKNVIGIAAGMLDGLNYTSLKGALMSRGTREISNLIKAMGGNEITVYGLCHLGDYQATLFSSHSHNRLFGEMFVTDKKYDKLAEGVSTTKALVKLGHQYKVDLPICNSIDKIINHSKDPVSELYGLFMREIKNEF